MFGKFTEYSANLQNIPQKNEYLVTHRIVLIPSYIFGFGRIFGWNILQNILPKPCFGRTLFPSKQPLKNRNLLVKVQNYVCFPGRGGGVQGREKPGPNIGWQDERHDVHLPERGGSPATIQLQQPHQQDYSDIHKALPISGRRQQLQGTVDKICPEAARSL